MRGVIARYARPALLALFSDHKRLLTWLEVELAVCAAMEALPDSPIPMGTAGRLRAACATLGPEGPINPERVLEIEQQTQHDVIAFLTHLEERLGADVRFLHLGLTSSDVVDTALAVVLRDAATLVLEGLEGRLLPALKLQALKHQRTVMMGRSHGIHAEPTTCGLVFAGSYAELQRAAERVRRARDSIAHGKLAGAVGIYGSGPVSPQVEAAALGELGLQAETVATQVVPRDRHAELLQALALLGAGIERLATTIRHWQRTEVGEAEEPFGKGQKGSSAMPHKKNPILAENLCGLSRLLRANAGAALEDIALWHERDISHSSLERVILPDSLMVADFMVHRAAGLVEGLVVKVERMRENLQRSLPLCCSEKVMLALVGTGLQRQAAYEIVQRAALAPGADGGLDASGFQRRLWATPAVSSRLSAEALAACFDLDHHLRFVDIIFARTFADTAGGA